MAQGKIKKFSTERGTGFLIDQQDGADIFFGDRSLRGLRIQDIRPGLIVDFDRHEGEKGPFARNIRVPVSINISPITFPEPIPQTVENPSATLTSSFQPPRATATATTGGYRRGVPRSLQPLTTIPAPESTRLAFERVSEKERHPGLFQDKFLIPCPDQKSQRDRLAEVVRTHQHGDNVWLQALRQRRDAAFRSLGTASWMRTSIAPLILHLARPTALENAGVAIHPIHGFPYVPGSSLKGIARSYAETVWLPQLEVDQQVWGRRQIALVFGECSSWSSEQDAPTTRECALASDQEEVSAGAVVFHDAWPETWPELFVEIVNNHHPRYYEGDENTLPSDWDSPLPVYFLAVKPRAKFQFALSLSRSARKRDQAYAQALIDQAQAWLNNCLTEIGVGAKTTVGYGAFEPLDSSTSLDWVASKSSHRIVQDFQAELATPAFLAGSFQSPSDCDLRPTTLRGLFRFWWRSLHANHLSLGDLRRLDAIIWGDSRLGSSIRTVLRTGELIGPSRYAYRSPKSRFVPDPRFKKKHKLEEAPPRTTQGLFYLSYGMDDHPNVPPRQHLEARSWWNVRLIARSRALPNIPVIDAEMAMEQGLAALWMLTQFGGVGSKSRKGFGSIQLRDGILSDWSLERCQAVAKKLRDLLGLPSLSQTRSSGPPSIESALILEPITTPWTNEWHALDQLGFAYQTFAQRFRHDRDQTGTLLTSWSRSQPAAVTKATLGLPRRIHGPRDDGPLKGQDSGTWEPSRWLDFPHPHRDPNKALKEARHSSPIHFRLTRTSQGFYQISAMAFPSPVLPTWDSSRRMLQACMEHLRSDLLSRVAQHEEKGKTKEKPVK